MAFTPHTLTCNGEFSVYVIPNVPHRWDYMTADAIADVNTAGYFAGTSHRGMRPGDEVRVVTMSGSTVSAVNTCAVMDVTTESADISNGVSLTLTDSD